MVRAFGMVSCKVVYVLSLGPKGRVLKFIAGFLELLQITLELRGLQGVQCLRCSVNLLYISPINKGQSVRKFLIILGWYGYCLLHV